MIPSFVVAAPVPVTPVEALSTSSHMVKSGPVQTRTIGKQGDPTLPGTKGKEVLRPAAKPALRQNTREKAIPQTGIGSRLAGAWFVEAGSGHHHRSRTVIRVE
jgi:hypothetical protein